MELEEAREYVAHWRNLACSQDTLENDVLIALSDRITKLESENEKLRDLVEDAGEIMTLRDRAVEEQHDRAERLEKIVVELGGVGALPIEK